tara:strand:+ start:40 stop:522 length:483 start_codon:yes stop_codon:yes gene_type:complete
MENKLIVFTELITKIARNIHKELGPGFTESVYQGALAIELRRFDINYLKEMNFEIFYKKQVAGEGRLDFFINDKKLPNLIVETKSLSCLNDSARSQITSYLLSAQLNSDSELKKTRYGVLINWPGASVSNNNSQLVNKEPEIEFYTLKNKTVSLMEVNKD